MRCTAMATPFTSHTPVLPPAAAARPPPAGRPLTDEQLAGEIGLIFFAGFETTGHTMAWTLYLLAEHPEAEAKVAAELDALGLLATPARPRPRPLEYEDLAQLRYLACVIKVGTAAAAAWWW